MSYQNNLPITIPFAPDHGKPMDNRLDQVQNVSDLNNIVAEHRYQGMTVFVLNEEEHYKLLNDKLTWVALSNLTSTPIGGRCVHTAFGVNVCTPDATLDARDHDPTVVHDVIAARSDDNNKKFIVSTTMASPSSGMRVAVVGDNGAELLLDPSHTSFTTGNLAVGKDTANSTLDVAGDLSAYSADIDGQIAAGSIDVAGDAGITGNAFITGALSAGSIESNSTLDVVGDATIGGSLGVADTATLADIYTEDINASGDLMVDGNADIGGDIDITGAITTNRISTTSSGIEIDGALDVNSNVSVDGQVATRGGVVAGDAIAPVVSHFIGDVSVTRDTDIAGMLRVGSIITATHGIDVTGDVDIVGDLHADNTFQKTDFVKEEIPGVDISGRPIVLNNAGYVDNSLLMVSIFTPMGKFTPTPADEYPFTDANTNPGALWTVDSVDPNTGYTFINGALAGETVLNGDLLIFVEYIDGVNDEFLKYDGGVNPSLYYMIDGSNPLTADFEAGNNKLVNVADGIAANDGATVGQLDIKLSKTGDTMTGDFGLQDNGGTGYPVQRWRDIAGVAVSEIITGGTDAATRSLSLSTIDTDGTTKTNELKINADGTTTINGDNIWNEGNFNPGDKRNGKNKFVPAVTMVVDDYLHVATITNMASVSILGALNSAYYAPSFKLDVFHVYNGVRYEFGLAHYETAAASQFSELVFTQQSNGADIKVYLKIGAIHTSIPDADIALTAEFSNTDPTEPGLTLVGSLVSGVNNVILTVPITNTSFRSTNVAPANNEFKGLTDTPASYLGQDKRIVRVREDLGQLEFADNAFILQTDTPDDYVSNAGLLVTVNSTEDALEFSTLPTHTHTIGNITGLQDALDDKETSLGNPTADGYLLSSLADGTRSWVPGGAGGGVTTFLGLTDTPAAYTGEAGRVPSVKASEDGLEFSDVIYVDEVAKNVMIGDGIATEKFEVAGTIKSTGRLRLSSADESTVRFENADNTLQWDITKTGTENNFRIGRFDDLGDVVDYYTMFFDRATGNIGLSKGSAGEKLDVNGKVKADDFIADDGSTLKGKENNLGNPTTDGYVLTSLIDGTRSWVPGGSGGGVTNFLGLTDTPADYTGKKGMASIVTDAEDGLEFKDVQEVIHMSASVTGNGWVRVAKLVGSTNGRGQVELSVTSTGGMYAANGFLAIIEKGMGVSGFMNVNVINTDPLFDVVGYDDTDGDGYFYLYFHVDGHNGTDNIQLQIQARMLNGLNTLESSFADADNSLVLTTQFNFGVGNFWSNGGDFDGNVTANSFYGISTGVNNGVSLSSTGAESAHLQAYESDMSTTKYLRIQPMGGNVMLGNGVPDEKLVVTGNVKADGFIGPGMVPVGSIIAYGGDIATIPADWALCDGNNGTPDLRNTFIYGGDGTNTGGTGGYADSVVISHTHTASASSTFTGTALADHAHTATFAGTALADHGHTASFSGTEMSTHGHSATFTGALMDPHDHGGGGFCGDSSGYTDGYRGDSTLVDVYKPVPEHTAGTPSGTVSVTSATAGTPAGSVSVTAEGAGTPAGSVTIAGETAGTPAGSVSTTVTVDSSGAAGTGLNYPPYTIMAYIMRIA